MARDRSPKCKQCRREGMKLFLKGERCLTEKCAIERRSYPPGEHGRGRIKQSEYLLQLREKQKARRYYGLLERQFRNYYERATRQPGVTGENLLRLYKQRYGLDYVALRRTSVQSTTSPTWVVAVSKRPTARSSQASRSDVVSSTNCRGPSPRVCAETSTP